MLDSQLRQDIGRVEARIVAQLAGDDFQRFGKRFDDGLLFPGNLLVGEAVQVARDFHLARAAPSHDAAVADGAFDDHDGVVQASLHLGYELFCAAAEDERAGFGEGAAFEEVEALAADLPLVEA